MLEKFHVPEDVEVRVNVADMRWTTEESAVQGAQRAEDTRQSGHVLMKGGRATQVESAR